MPCLSDEAFDLRSLLEHGRRLLGEPEARHQIGHEAEAAVIDVAAQFLRIRLVDEAEQRRGVAVVDEFRRHEGVQQHLHRGRGGQRVDQEGALRPRHILVGKCFARAQCAQLIEPHGGKTGGLDRAHVPARAFDVKRLDLPAGKIARLGLQRGIAAAVQHEVRIGADQPRGIDAQRQVGRDALLAVTVDRGLGVALDPGGFHLASRMIGRMR